ncbi:hypothetical protein MSG28_008864 [Choristoneura fumiferana]|uniref:Uncharacterized protein n=1 Tax=Choristoneura fumiferana TaxID=7141 RepID=A0ACC0J892_CHOFU|nr:hypothetical protein MSG28_008864 [Choristoneura fumiferana]
MKICNKILTHSFLSRRGRRTKKELWAKVFQMKEYVHRKKREIKTLLRYIELQEQFEVKLDKCITSGPDDTRTTNPWEWSNNSTLTQPLLLRRGVRNKKKSMSLSYKDKGKQFSAKNIKKLSKRDRVELESKIQRVKAGTKREKLKMRTLTKYITLVQQLESKLDDCVHNRPKPKPSTGKPKRTTHIFDYTWAYREFTYDDFECGHNFPETDQTDTTYKPSDDDTKDIAAKIENGKVQAYRIKLKMKEILEYKVRMERFERKLDMCIERERTDITSAPWWPTKDQPDTEGPSEEDTATSRRTKRPRKPSTPPYYLLGAEYYEGLLSAERNNLTGLSTVARCYPGICDRRAGPGGCGCVCSAECCRGSCDESSTIDGRGGKFSLTIWDKDRSLEALVSPE